MLRRVLFLALLAAPWGASVLVAAPRDDAGGQFEQQVQRDYRQCGTSWYAAADVVLPPTAGEFARRAVKPRTIYVRFDDVTWSIEEVPPSAADQANGVTFRGRGLGAAGSIVRKDVFPQGDGAAEWTNVKPTHRIFQGRDVFLDQTFELRGRLISRSRFDFVAWLAWSDGLEQYMRRRRPSCEEVPR